MTNNASKGITNGINNGVNNVMNCGMNNGMNSGMNGSPNAGPRDIAPDASDAPDAPDALDALDALDGLDGLETKSSHMSGARYRGSEPDASRMPIFVRACDLLGLPAHKMLFLLSDLFVLFAAFLVAALLRTLMGNYHNWTTSLPTTFVIILFSPFIAVALGLYSDTFLRAPHETLCRIVWYVSTVFAIMFLVFFLSKEGALHSRFVYLTGWSLACLGVPLARHVLRHRFARASWWGSPLVFLNHTEMGKSFWHYLRKHPEKDFKPVCFVDLPPEIDGQAMAKLKDAANKYRGAVAMVAVPHGGISRTSIMSLTQVFSRLIVMPLSPETDVMRQFHTEPFVLNTNTGFFLQIRLHDKRRLLVKRAMDLVLCAAGAVVLLPLFFALALAVRLDSKGPVFYSQRRIGQNGRVFQMHKFRTMVVDADKKLAECLARDPELAAEWARDQKLKNDPRVTRVGRILRSTSLDELPQLINVVLGDMTLVGPRPIVDAEKAKYDHHYREYMRVRPGITGLWQISGRNDTSYRERVMLDSFYVSNWTIWFDIWILAKTVPVVLFRRGAY